MNDQTKTKEQLITELASARQHIAELEATDAGLYRFLFEHVNDAIFIHSQNILQVNQAACDYLGYSREELLHMSTADFVSPEDRAKMKGRFQYLQEHGALLLEATHIRKDGTTVPVEINARFIEYQGESAILSLVRDITKRKQAEEALRQRLQQEQAIATMSANFINRPSNEMDDTINQALAMMGQIVEVDRSYLFLINEDGTMDNTHEWCAERVEPHKENLQGVPVGALPWFIDKMNQFETLQINRVANLPPAAEAEKQLWQEQDIHSLLCVPMVYQNRLVGFAGFDVVGHEKDWQEEAIFLKRMAHDLLNALQRRQAEVDRQQLQQEIVESQQRLIQELSVPIIPVMDQVIVMPLIGSIDSMRARDLMRTLLAGISEHRAKVVILDITGVPIVDTGVVAHLDKTIQAARLKGSRTIVTGISDAVAEALVDLGIDWSQVETLRDLQTGLRTVLNKLNYTLSNQ